MIVINRYRASYNYEFPFIINFCRRYMAYRKSISPFRKYSSFKKIISFYQCADREGTWKAFWAKECFPFINQILDEVHGVQFRDFPARFARPFCWKQMQLSLRKDFELIPNKFWNKKVSAHQKYAINLLLEAPRALTRALRSGRRAADSIGRSPREPHRRHHKIWLGASGRWWRLAKVSFLIDVMAASVSICF